MPTPIDRFDELSSAQTRSDNLEFDWDIVNEDLGTEPTWDTEGYYPVGHGVVKTHQDNKISVGIPSSGGYQSAYLSKALATTFPSTYTVEVKTVFRALPEELIYSVPTSKYDYGVRFIVFDELYRMSIMISRTNIGITRDSQGFGFTDLNTFDVVQEYDKEYVWRITMDRGAPSATSPVQTIYRNGLLVTAFIGDNDYHPVAAHRAWVIQAVKTDYEIDFDLHYFKIAEGIWKPLNRYDDLSTAITRFDEEV